MYPVPVGIQNTFFGDGFGTFPLITPELVSGVLFLLFKVKADFIRPISPRFLILL